MKPFSTYISCPIAVRESVLKKFVDLAMNIDSGFTDTQYWIRGTPYVMDSVIIGCDAFVLILPDNKFNIRISELPPGCKKELVLASANNKCLYIGYLTGGETPQIYRAHSNGITIGASAGSSGDLKRAISDHKLVMKSRVSPLNTSQTVTPVCEVKLANIRVESFNYDERLLLMLL